MCSSIEHVHDSLLVYHRCEYDWQVIEWCKAVLDGLDVIDALFLSLVGGLGFAVPVPGGIGAFHFIIGLALSMVYGLPMEMGIVYATLSHTSQAITQIVFGLFSYIYETVRR